MAEGHEPLVCATCGKVTGDRAHLCTPAKLSDLYTCASCGALAPDPGHICEPEKQQLRFACKRCRRLTHSRDALCEPEELSFSPEHESKIPYPPQEYE